MIKKIKTEDKDKLLAGVDFIRRTGAKDIQIRYSNDGQPIVYFVVAEFDGQNPYGIKGFEVDASTTTMGAVLRLCERLADGGRCQHCNRPSGFEPHQLVRMPFDGKICWYQYDPELKRYRRGCE